MASNQFVFFLVLCLCVLSTAEFGEAQIQTGKICTDPNGKDIKSECFGYCTDIGFLGGSCQGYKNHYMCKCYVG
ncbi:defensin-like protein 34 [Raphanus sativus]|uniref:Defensin-like protein 34 n=1 Tax=Raphanus sativus TaxID=3726 RepID=A0A6J0MBI5_RAPSA|nr:defensin-like protein 34 [Raphanus sativus]